MALESLEKQREIALNNLHDIDDKMAHMKAGIALIKKPLSCPKCQTNEWVVYVTYDPFHKIAWEDRTIKLVCKNCKYELVEHVETEHGN